MKISYNTIVGDGTKVTQPLRDAIVRCFDRALAHCTVSPTVSTVLCFEKHQAKEKQYTATVTVRAEGKKQIVRSATTDDMYKSIDLVSEMVEREVHARKQKREQKRTPRLLVDQPLPSSNKKQKKVA